MTDLIKGYARLAPGAWIRLPGIGNLPVAGDDHRHRAIAAAKLAKLAALHRAGEVTDAQFQRHWARLFPEPA